MRHTTLKLKTVIFYCTAVIVIGVIEYALVSHLQTPYENAPHERLPPTPKILLPISRIVKPSKSSPEDETRLRALQGSPTKMHREALIRSRRSVAQASTSTERHPSIGKVTTKDPRLDIIRQSVDRARNTLRGNKETTGAANMPLRPPDGYEARGFIPPRAPQPRDTRIPRQGLLGPEEEFPEGFWQGELAPLPYQRRLSTREEEQAPPPMFSNLDEDEGGDVKQREDFTERREGLESPVPLVGAEQESRSRDSVLSRERLVLKLPPQPDLRQERRPDAHQLPEGNGKGPAPLFSERKESTSRERLLVIRDLPSKPLGRHPDTHGQEPAEGNRQDSKAPAPSFSERNFHSRPVRIDSPAAHSNEDAGAHPVNKGVLQSNNLHSEEVKMESHRTSLQNDQWRKNTPQVQNAEGKVYDYTEKLLLDYVMQMEHKSNPRGPLGEQKEADAVEKHGEAWDQKKTTGMFGGDDKDTLRNVLEKKRAKGEFRENDDYDNYDEDDYEDDDYYDKDYENERGNKLEVFYDDFEIVNTEQGLKIISKKYQPGPEILVENSTKPRMLTPFEEDGGNIMLTLRTTVPYHQKRLPLLLNTWMTKVNRSRVFLVTDGHDRAVERTANTIGMNYVVASCGRSYLREELCCKAGVELALLFKPGNEQYDWLCHIDDDIYVNLKPLIQLLSKFNPKTEPIYLGRSGSEWRRPRRVHHNIKLGKPGQRYHFAVGGMYCLSRVMLEEARPYLVGGKAFAASCSKTQEPEDVTVGFIVGVVLNHTLQRTEQIYTHGLHLSSSVDPFTLRNQIAFAYGYGSVKWGEEPYNAIYVPDGIFELEEDESQFKSLHCHLYPDTPWCRRKELENLRRKPLPLFW